MNEQLQNALAEIIQKATTGIDAATEFLAAEMPDVVYQLLLWYGVKSAIMCALGAALILLWLYAWCKFSGPCKGINLTHFEDEVSPHFMASLAVMWIPLALSASMLNLDWLQIAIAPKIWLIEYAATLVK